MNQNRYLFIVIAFFSFFTMILTAENVKADCMAPFGVTGAMSVVTTSQDVEYCNGSVWISMDNGAPSAGEGNAAGCTLIASLLGQLVYSNGIYKACYFTGVTVATKLQSPAPALITPPAGIPGVAGKLYFHPLFHEPVFYNGTSWFRTRPNSLVLTVPGVYTFYAPGVQSSLQFRMWGGGGSGGAATNGTTCAQGTDGGNTTLTGTPTTVTAGGGIRGGNGATCDTLGTGGTPINGDAGSASGGTSNDNAGRAGAGGGGAGGVAPGNGNANGNNGVAPGGGGSSNSKACCFLGLGSLKNRGGGGGAYVFKSYGPGAVSPNTAITITVGAGGAAHPGGGNPTGAGGNGRVEITWN